MKITQLPIPGTPRREWPGYIKEPRTNPEVLARGARGQHRASLRRALREAGMLFPHNRKRVAKRERRALGLRA